MKRQQEQEDLEEDLEDKSPYIAAVKWGRLESVIRRGKERW